MAYNYLDERAKLFTEEGVDTLTKIRDNTKSLLRAAGAVRLMEAIGVASGDGWTLIAAMDYMVEKGEIREVTQADVAGQRRVFVAA